MKKLFLLASVVALMASCGQKAENEKAEKDAPAAEAKGGLKIAYLEYDSLMTKYQFCKDYSDIMAQEYANIQKELAGKQRALEMQAASFQQKYENNGFTTKDQVERAQAGLNQMQQELAMLNERLSNQFAENQANYTKEVHDSIQAYVKAYNKEKKYDFILSKSGDNLLYANPAYDVTDEIIDGLNKRYKVKPEVAEKLKTVDKSVVANTTVPEAAKETKK